MVAEYRELAERKDFFVARGGFEPLIFGLTSRCYWQPERLAHDFAVVVKSSGFPVRVDRRIALGWADQRGRLFGTPRQVDASHGRDALDAVILRGQLARGWHGRLPKTCVGVG